MLGRLIEPVVAAKLELGREALAAIHAHVAAAYPEEACGGLFGRTRDGAPSQVIEAVRVANASPTSRACSYLIGPNEVLRLERRAEAAGLQVLGYYHSHPDAPAEPSADDRQHAWPWYVYLIVSARAGRAGAARAWQLDHGRSNLVPVRLRLMGKSREECGGR